VSLDGFIAGPGGDMSWLTEHLGPTRRWTKGDPDLPCHLQTEPVNLLLISRFRIRLSARAPLKTCAARTPAKWARCRIVLEALEPHDSLRA
jgi:hypothetical protein